MLVVEFPSSLQVQLLLYSQVAAEFSVHRLGNTTLDLRDVVGVGQLMFILKEYYSLASSSSSSSASSHADIRPYILLIAKQFIIRVSANVVSNYVYNILH